MSRMEVDRLNRNPAIGDDIDRYPPRVFLVGKSLTLTRFCVVLKGLKGCQFTFTSPPFQPVTEVQSQGNVIHAHFCICVMC